AMTSVPATAAAIVSARRAVPPVPPNGCRLQRAAPPAQQRTSTERTAADDHQHRDERRLRCYHFLRQQVRHKRRLVLARLRRVVEVHGARRGTARQLERLVAREIRLIVAACRDLL